ncbi:MAG: hypothetical protein K2O58_03890, partial [Bacteroidales bacterium]|nr:hypothetical protein [Bacteroidales bacterium]
VWVFTLWPSAIMYAVAYYFADVRMKDKMMESTFLICLSVLFWIPLFAILTFVLAGIFISWWVAAAWVLLFPAIFIFAQSYASFVKSLKQDMASLKTKQFGNIINLRRLRRDIYRRLDKITGE